MTGTVPQAVADFLADFGVRAGDPAGRESLAKALVQNGITEDDCSVLSDWFADRERREGMSNIGGIVAHVMMATERWKDTIGCARRVFARVKDSQDARTNRSWEQDQAALDLDRAAIAKDAAFVEQVRRLMYHTVDLEWDLATAAAYDDIPVDHAEWMLEHAAKLPETRYVRQEDRPAAWRYPQWDRTKKRRKPLPKLGDPEDSKPRDHAQERTFRTITSLTSTASDHARKVAERDEAIRTKQWAARKLRLEPEDIGPVYGE